MPTSLLSCLVCIAAYTPPDVQLSDRDRFPPQSVAAAQLRAWREYRRRLEQEQPIALHRYESWREECAQAKHVYDCWDWLNAALGGEGREADYWTYSLRRLRELIGDEAYFSGQITSAIADNED